VLFSENKYDDDDDNPPLAGFYQAGFSPEPKSQAADADNLH